MAVASSPTSKTVCVMDASGSLGAALVDKLLQRGYTVHAATSNYVELEKLKALSMEKPQLLKAFESDPLDYHGILRALRGCSALFYNFNSQAAGYDELMCEYEVRVAHNVLEACGQIESMERVVFTSSATAVLWRENRVAAPSLDERDWTDPNFCKKFKLWYALAKTVAERTAWALAMDRGVDMVSVNAGLLTGPDLSPSNPYLKGSPEMYEDGVLVTVDLDFLVDSHLRVFEANEAYGRYLCFNHAVCRPEEAVKLARMLNPAATCSPASNDLRAVQQRIHNKKLNRLMECQSTSEGSIHRPSSAAGKIDGDGRLRVIV